MINLKPLEKQIKQMSKKLEQLEKIKGLGAKPYYHGGGGVNVETPSGTQDGSNTTFIVTRKTKFMTFNGQAIFEDAGYSRSNLTLTLDVAPTSIDVIRSIY